MVDSRDGVQIALTPFGGSGPKLLISHATGLNASAYRPLATALSGSFDVWGFDHRGHGSSTRPDNSDFRWSLMAEDLLAVVDYLQVDSLAAFGHSMGATAILLANQQRPGVIDGAYLFEPIIFPVGLVDPTEVAPRNSIMAAAALKRRRSFPSKEAALARYASRPPLGLLRADALAAYVDGGFVELDDGTVELACAPESEAATFDNAGLTVTEISGDPIRALIGAGQPVEAPSPAEFAAAAAAALENATFKEYPSLGHFGPLQLPDLIAHDVAEFLLR